jgi:DNA-directed RNA polymerase subunit K/omega
MVTRPPQMNAYEFVVLSALRAGQLMAGSTPRLSGECSAITMAQMEVADGQILRDENPPIGLRQRGWQI